MGPLTKDIMTSALNALNIKIGERLNKKITLIMGGGGAMILAHRFPLGTTDIDAIPKAGITHDELDPMVKEIAVALSLPPDWLNPYFSNFVTNLPSDYQVRLISVFDEKFLQVQALGKEDMLIMKCFAHRKKDIGHARALFKLGANIDFVQTQLEKLNHQKIPEAAAALKFLEEIIDLEEG